MIGRETKRDHKEKPQRETTKRNKERQRETTKRTTKRDNEEGHLRGKRRKSSKKKRRRKKTKLCRRESEVENLSGKKR